MLSPPRSPGRSAAEGRRVGPVEFSHTALRQVLPIHGEVAPQAPEGQVPAGEIGWDHVDMASRVLTRSQQAFLRRHKGITLAKPLRSLNESELDDWIKACAALE